MSRTEMSSSEDEIAFRSAAERIARRWARYSAPVRPHPSGLVVYKDALVGHEAAAPRVLILGATPELVDMAVSNGASRIVSIEVVPALTAAMKMLATTDWTRVEFLVGNWLDLDERLQDSFDLVFCDGGTLFLDFPDEWHRLFANVLRYLAPGGTFVTKMQDYSDDHGISFEDMLGIEMENFDKIRKSKCSIDQLEKHFGHMVCAIYSAAFLGVVDANTCKIDFAKVRERTSHALKMFVERYPEPEFSPYLEMYTAVQGTGIGCGYPPSHAPAYALVVPVLETEFLNWKRIELPDDHPPRKGAAYMILAAGSKVG